MKGGVRRGVGGGFQWEEGLMGRVGGVFCC